MIAEPIRVMIVDNYPVVRMGISARLQQEPDIEVVAEDHRKGGDRPR